LCPADHIVRPNSKIVGSAAPRCSTRLTRSDTISAFRAPQSLSCYDDTIRMNAYADFVCRRRGVLALLIVGLSVLAAGGLTRLEFDEEPRTVFIRRDAEYARLERLFAEFGPDDTDVLVAVETPDLFTLHALESLKRLVERLQQVPHVESVDSLLRARRPDLPVVPLISGELTPEDLPRIREQALSHPAVAGQFLSADGNTTFLIVHLRDPSAAISIVTPQINDLRAAVAEVTAGTPLKVGLAGHPVGRVDAVALSRAETFRTMAQSALITTIVGFLSFRNAASVWAALSGPMLGTFWMLGVLGWMGEKLNGLNTAIPSLVYVIAFGDSVHMIVEFTHARLQGRDRTAALHRMMVLVGQACVLMVFTTVVGFGALAIAELEAIRRFGIASAVGTFVGFLAVLMILPLMLGSRLGDYIGNRRPNEPEPASEEEFHADGWAARWSRLLLRAPRSVAAASIIGTALLVVAAAGLQPDIQWLEFLPPDSATAQMTRLSDDKIGGSLPSTVVVEWPEGEDPSPPPHVVLREVHHILESHAPLRGPFSALNLAAGAKRNGSIDSVTLKDSSRVPPAVLAKFVRPDLRRALVTIHTPDAGASRLLPVFSAVDKELDELERRRPGYRCELTGTAVVAARNVYGIIDDAAKSLLLSGVVIIATMMIAFRSIRLGLLCVVPTLFPVVAVAGGLALLGEPLRIAGAMTFSVCLGLADDNTIHLVSRFRQELGLGRSVRTAVEHALGSSGPAMVIMSVTLAAGLLPTVWGSLPATAMIGGLTIAALAASVVADLVILPPLLVCFVRENSEVGIPSDAESNRETPAAAS
jgi:uncharacterized protein